MPVQAWYVVQKVRTELGTPLVERKGKEKKEQGGCPMKIWNYTWGEYEFFNDADDFCSYGEQMKGADDEGHDI